jgi:hypothetical protein
MKTTILAYVIALGGVAIIALGLWGLYTPVRVAERRLRDYIPTIQTIAVGFGLIGVAQALRLLLLIFADAAASHHHEQNRHCGCACKRCNDCCERKEVHNAKLKCEKHGFPFGRKMPQPS